MIDEQELRDLIREAADSIPPPGRAPEQLVARLERPAAPARSTGGGERRTTFLKVAAAIAVLVGIGAVLLNLGGGAQHARFNDVGASIPKTAADGGDALAEGGGTAPENTLPSGPKPATDGAKIVKTGSIDIEVRSGGFDAAIARITSEAVGLGGYVKSSTTSQAGGEPNGSITVRVPVDSYEALLAKLRQLGTVGSVTSKGTDVTAQVTDLEARLTALTATRDQLSAVLARATTVADILAVQDRITQVQTQIEQLQGQQQVLEDQAAYATLSATVGEPGSKVTEEPDDEGGLGQAWDAAKRRFGDGIEGIVAWSGPIAIALILGAILFVIGRLAWVLVRRFTM
jgi:hypothetical protein